MILVTGAGGQLGRELLRPAASALPAAGLAGAASGAGRDLPVLGLAHAELDITDVAAVAVALRECGARLVINAAAWTDVDGAERAPERAFAVNRDGAAVLAEACAGAGIPLFHVSTDHVFDGRPGAPWRETDALSPLGIYGASKAAGEAAIRARLPAHLILRTSWVFGVHGDNFVRALLRRAQAGESLAVVTDHIGGPTPSRALAGALLALARRHLAGEVLPWGSYHFAGQPFVSRHAFAVAVLAAAQQRGLLAQTPTLRAIRAVDWPGAPLRPANACLDGDKAQRLLGLAPPDWRPALVALLDEWRPSLSLNRLQGAP